MLGSLLLELIRTLCFREVVFISLTREKDTRYGRSTLVREDGHQGSELVREGTLSGDRS